MIDENNNIEEIVNSEDVLAENNETVVENNDGQNEVSEPVQTNETAETNEVSENTEEDEHLKALREEAKWYVLHTFSGYENVAKENLQIVTDKYNLHERIFDILIPMEDCVEEKNGKRKIVQRKLMPGYIIVKMIYGDDIWHAVTRTRGITGFVGPKGRPLPLGPDEIKKLRLEKVAVINTDLSVGDKVEVLEGALFGFEGEIVGIDTEANKCRVMVEMFGRETPVDLTLEQIKKIN